MIKVWNKKPLCPHIENLKHSGKDWDEMWGGKISTLCKLCIRLYYRYWHLYSLLTVTVISSVGPMDVS